MKEADLVECIDRAPPGELAKTIVAAIIAQLIIDVLTDEVRSRISESDWRNNEKEIVEQLIGQTSENV